MNEGEKARKYFVTCIGHYCVFEDRNLLLSEPEVHAEIFGAFMIQHKEYSLYQHCHLGECISLFYADNSPSVMINLKNISALITSRSNWLCLDWGTPGDFQTSESKCASGHSSNLIRAGLGCAQP